MVDLSAQQTDRVFHALSDATRRQILAALSRGDSTVGELAAPFAISLAGVSKHIKVLEQAKLIRIAKQGRRHICQLNPKTLRTAQEVLAYYEKFWNRRLDALQAHFSKRNDR
jgi:DNA-binding transcriptional ArsR family regulator